MVIRGNIRGNGPQLAQYLINERGHEGGNERIQIVEVDGRENASAAYLQQALHTMSLTAELTRTDKGLYHAQISPAYGEDQRMSHEDWRQAADILGHELGLGEQRRVIVLHTKKDRTHAHVVFERYDHATGRVIENRFSRLAQDRARHEMELVFNHQRTPHRNQHRPELKATLTKLWQETQTADAFMQAAHANGYMLAEGVPRHPFMVVDENGRSFDLVRQLTGIRIKQVRQRFKGVSLIPEKQAIETMRQRQESKGAGANTPSRPDDDNPQPQSPAQTDRTRQSHKMSLFWENGPDMTDNTAHNMTKHLPQKEKQPNATPAKAADLGASLPQEPYQVQVNPITYDASGLEDKAKPAPQEPYKIKINPITYTQSGLPPTQEKPAQPEQEKPAQAKPTQETQPVADTTNPDKQRQQAKFDAFMDNANSGPPAPDSAPEPADSIQQLMDEQKAKRQRTQQRNQQRGPKRRR